MGSFGAPEKHADPLKYKYLADPTHTKFQI